MILQPNSSVPNIAGKSLQQMDWELLHEGDDGKPLAESPFPSLDADANRGRRTKRGNSEPTHELHGDSSSSENSRRKRSVSCTSFRFGASSLNDLTVESAVAYDREESPQFPSQAVFSIRDTTDVVPQRRPRRRRTGPLRTQQRARAALIRKLGACSNCRRRRVAVSTRYLHTMSAPNSNRPFQCHANHQT